MEKETDGKKKKEKLVQMFMKYDLNRMIQWQQLDLGQIVV